MTAVDLVNVDGKTLSSDSALKVERKHPIVARGFHALARGDGPEE